MKTETRVDTFTTLLGTSNIEMDLDFIPTDNFGVELDAEIYWVFTQKVSKEGIEEDSKLISHVTVDVTWITENEDIHSIESTQPNHRQIIYHLEDCEHMINNGQNNKPYELHIDNEKAVVLF